jgi:hypothetical protein
MGEKQMYVSSVEVVAQIGQTIKLNSVDYDRDNVSKLTAKETKEIVRQIVGRKTIGFPYLCTSQTVKLDKSNKLNQELNVVMHLAPSNLSGYQVCPLASKGCRASCLNTSGKGRLSGCQIGRIKKTKLFFEHRELFKHFLFLELAYWQKKANKYNMTLAVRLNGTSDIKWERVFPDMFEQFNQVKFYDYTKIDNRFNPLLNRIPTNYFLTFSRAEDNDAACQRLMAQGVNIAVVFNNFKKALEEGYQGRQVINGEKSDRRYADPRGVVVGLPALGDAKKDATGFVVNN